MKSYSKLGEYVKGRRQLLELTQAELAEKCGVKQSTISRLESGLLPKLDSDVMLRLASALGTTSDYLEGKTQEIKLGELVQGDKNFSYLYEMYRSLTGSEIQQLIRFAEFSRYRGLNYKDLIETFRELFAEFRRYAEANEVPQKSNPVYESAEKMIAEIVMNRAMREVELEGE